MPRHIYIDCTETARVGALTGIQRTVRSIVHAALVDGDDTVVPVRYDGARFVPLDAKSQAALLQGVAHRRAFRERTRRLAVSSLAPAVQGEWLARGRDVASRSYWTMRRLRAMASHAAPIRYAPGDWLVLLDSTWTPDVRREIAHARTGGARVCAVIYDLIKVRRPDLASPGAARIYERWLERVMPLSDLVATISRAVADDVVDYLRASGRPGLAGRVRHFVLGADFQAQGNTGAVSPEVASALDGHRDRTFLAVGSLEHRKDQATIVTAFERLWAEGTDARLVLVGRPGWGSDRLARKLAAHPERGTRLFWFSQASDADLAHCYRNALALVNVSLAEGYGLPLVEGMRHGLRAIASDIPAFREVAGTGAVFVPTADAAKLAEAIASVLRAPVGAAASAPATATWNESAQALLALLREADQGLP
jgi:glycosyltransferase involved in cell wall biosynthesis